MDNSKKEGTGIEQSLFGRGPLLLLTGALLLGIVSSQPTQVAFHSSEVAFTDTSRSGFAIVPASCPSAPPPLTADGGGWNVPNGTRRAEINRHGYIYCVTNNTGSSIFAPANTAGEFVSFINGAAAIGVQVVPQSTYPYYCHYTDPSLWLYLAYGWC